MKTFNTPPKSKMEKVTNEVWSPIVGFVGKYEVSTFGRVRSVNRLTPYRNSFKSVKERVLKPGLSSNGYLTVRMSAISYLIHRLVCEAFIPNTKSLNQINHKNKVRTDNIVSNLEWVSCRENAAHRDKRSLPSGLYKTRSGKYLVQIHVNKKNKHVGIYVDIPTAIMNRDLAMVYFGLENKYHHAHL